MINTEDELRLRETRNKKKNRPGNNLKTQIRNRILRQCLSNSEPTGGDKEASKSLRKDGKQKINKTKIIYFQFQFSYKPLFQH